MRLILSSALYAFLLCSIQHNKIRPGLALLRSREPTQQRVRAQNGKEVIRNHPSGNALTQQPASLLPIACDSTAESWRGRCDSAMMEWHPSPHGGLVHAELVSGYPLFSPATDQ